MLNPCPHWGHDWIITHPETMKTLPPTYERFSTKNHYFEVASDWDDAACLILWRYKWDSADAWRATIFRTEDAEHQRSKGLIIVHRWLENLA